MVKKLVVKRRVALLLLRLMPLLLVLWSRLLVLQHLVKRIDHLVVLLLLLWMLRRHGQQRGHIWLLRLMPSHAEDAKHLWRPQRRRGGVRLGSGCQSRKTAAVAVVAAGRHVGDVAKASVTVAVARACVSRVGDRRWRFPVRGGFCGLRVGCFASVRVLVQPLGWAVADVVDGGLGGGAQSRVVAREVFFWFIH